MNPVQFQMTEKLPDHHAHVCPRCNASFTHRKSRIAPGLSHEAHLCPNCNKPVNDRVELSAFDVTPTVSDWYGPGSAPVATSIPGVVPVPRGSLKPAARRSRRRKLKGAKK